MTLLAAALAASIAISSPADRAELPLGDIHIALAGRGLENGHAHVVIDAGPALEASLEAPLLVSGLAPGPHTVRAVLVDKDHVSIKSVRALAVSRIWVGPRSAGVAADAAEERAWPDPGKPILTLVLPTGEPTSAPVLDVHVRGATLARRGSMVRIVIDKKEYPLLTEERPRRLKLKKGKHRITVDLIDARGTKVGNVLNRTDRYFVVESN